MSSYQILIWLTVATLLVACGKSTVQNRYQLIATTDGHALRIDTAEGDVFLVEDNVLMRIPEDSKLALSVGHVYKFEDGRWMKYVGNGNFEPAQKVIDWKDLPSK